MKFLKTTMLSLSLIFAANFVTAKKADAGIFLAPATGGMSAVMLVGQGVMIGATGAKFLKLIGYKDMFRLWGLGMMLVALDESEEATINNISTVLSSKYPMIADQTVFEDIAVMVVNSTDFDTYNYGVMDVKVNENELRDVLSRVDSSNIEADLEQLVQDLI